MYELWGWCIRYCFRYVELLQLRSRDLLDIHGCFVFRRVCELLGRSVRASHRLDIVRKLQCWGVLVGRVELMQQLPRRCLSAQHSGVIMLELQHRHILVRRIEQLHELRCRHLRGEHWHVAVLQLRRRDILCSWRKLVCELRIGLISDKHWADELCFM